MEVANARPPYNSTLIQTDFDLASSSGGAPGMPELSGVVQGEKQW
jgi:hypothetical protein